MNWPFVTRKKYDTDMLEKECELFIQMGEIFELSMENDDLHESNDCLTEELKACWKYINGKPKKGHWQKQKRVNGRWSK